MNIHQKRGLNWLKAIKKLSLTQQASIAFLLFISVSLPLSIVLVGRQTLLMSKANFSITSSVTPTPIIVYNIPAITTKSLSNAKVGKIYNQRVEGYDPNEENSLTISAKRLPQGLELTRCKNVGKNYNYVGCDITGIPQEIGTFDVILQIDDNNNNIIVKTLQLKVLE